MIAAKTYQHKKYMEHLTYVNVEGRNVSVHFKGGTFAPKRINGTFSTKDPKIIEAIDNDLRTGTLWKCIRGESPKQKKKSTINPVADKGAFSSGTTAPKSIKTVQAAREFLIENVDGINPSVLTNKQTVLDAARKANVAFPGIS